MGKVNLLLVEKKEDVRDSLVSSLIKRDMEVEVAVSEEEALNKLKNISFDVVVAGIDLPAMDGRGFLAKVRKVAKTLPVILITGCAGLESVKESVKLDAFDYLLKPLEAIEDLLEPIYKAVYSHRLLFKNRQLTNNLRAKAQILKRTECKYRDLFESASDIIYVVDSKGMITSANQKMEKITEYNRDELIGNPAEKFIVSNEEGLYSWKGREHWIEELREAVEVKIVAKNGEVRLGEMDMRLIKEKNVVIGSQCIVRDITEREKTEVALRASETKLQEQKVSLEQKNTALREVLEQIELEKQRIKEDICINVDRLLLPVLKRMKRKANSLDAKYIDIIHHNLEKLTSSFGHKIKNNLRKLSLREIEICNMVNSGFTSKEIAEILNVSLQTIEKHRNNIRRKLGIVNKDINLASYLQVDESAVSLELTR